ncbi:MAG: hypothetical protein CBB69_006180 [Phycisphaera sp. TMED9]|nr:MAG: hypothetical protein CBB69_006180 [Phycisphaera sp. TMED9]
MNLLHNTITTLAALAVAGTASAQSTQIPAPPQEQPLLVLNASLHPVSNDHPAVVNDGWVRFDAGRITAVGEGGPPKDMLEDATIIDAGGLSLVPGFISSASQIGLLEVGQVQATDDRSESGDRNPEAAAWIAVNPDSDLIPVARSAGILHTLAMPQRGTIPGRASILRMDGWTTEDLALVRDAGVIVSWPMAASIRAPWMRRGSGAQRSDINARLKAIDLWFDDAQAWADARAADPTVATDLRFEAMQPILRGERPLFIRADSRGQIETALAWASARGFRPVIVGGGAATECLPLLKETGASVILTEVHRLPSARHHAIDRPFTVAAALHQAGIPFAIAAEDEPAHERGLAHHAATAAAHGLPHHVALHAITRGPAEIIGVGDRLGSLEDGHSATFFLCDGDPLDIANPPMRAWIDGREIDLGDRQKRLYSKYQEKYRQKGLIDG